MACPRGVGSIPTADTPTAPQPRSRATVCPTMPGGRPSPIDAIIATHNGQPVTVADRITSLVNSGLPFGLACQAAGIHRDTGIEWRRTAGRILISAKGRTTDELDLTDHERRCLQFSDSILRAEGEAAGRYQLLAERLIEGGIPITRTVTREKRDAAGNVIERITTTTTEETLPSESMIRWWFEHRFPTIYGPKLDVTTHTDKLTDEETAESLVESLEAYLQGQADAKPKTKKAGSNGDTPNGQH